MKVANSSGTGFYETTKYSCTCPDYVYRKAKEGGICKHIAFNFYHVTVTQEPSEKRDVYEYFKEAVLVNKANEKYGYKKIMELLENYTIVELGKSVNRVYTRFYKLM